jgi:hypothetical protein
MTIRSFPSEDIVMHNGDVALLEGNAAIAAISENIARSWRGEFQYNPLLGAPYVESVFKGGAIGAWESYVRSRVLLIDGVLSVSFSYSQGEGGALLYSMDIETSDVEGGFLVSGEISL